MENSQVDALKRLGLSEKEIAEVIECDKRIDKGEKLFELSADQKKATKEMTIAGNINGYTKPKKNRNSEKEEIITAISEVLQADEMSVTNPEREIVFSKNGTKYKIVLSCPRK